MKNKFALTVILSLIISVMLPASTTAYIINDDGPTSTEPRISHRLIVELASPSLTMWASTSTEVGAAEAMPSGRLDVSAGSAQTYIQQLVSEQRVFIQAVKQRLPSVQVATYQDEHGRTQEATYQIVMNAVALDPGRDADTDQVARMISRMEGVKFVYLDYAYEPDMYASLPLINADDLWSHATIGGKVNAGAGIKVASMDGGVHKDAPMFDGTGFSYPPGYPLGYTSNTNGKIIVSRAYFRTWDPPAPGDENPWPGEAGTSHGVHTASIAVGNEVTADYGGATETISGVAPAAYVMSYRVFYGSISGDGSFYTVEGIAALEDIVADGADAVNNSWGGGPSSSGGVFDALDAALINAWNAGVFVSMSNGNAGPGLGTGDHPSSQYINVAASTTDGTYASGRLNVTAPEPLDPDLQGIAYGLAMFGEPLPFGTVLGPYEYATSISVDPTNVTGCAPFPVDSFLGKAALISRGDCYFSDKVYNAEQAGAVFAVIYNNAGDDLITMSCGSHCGPGEITIPSNFIGQTDGEGMVTWHDDAMGGGQTPEFEVDTSAFQIGNEPDIIASFSSRGPSVGNVLKPDLLAPGINILAQGFTPGATGEDRHLGYGQASGTSMAAPHVTGTFALLQQVHPDWSNAWIKSAMMSTSKYLHVYNHDDTPAQPLDMGAGRLDLANAADPGVILNPPSLSFGQVMDGETATLTFLMTNVAGVTESYDLSSVYTGDGFDVLLPVAGMTVTPSNVTLDQGESTLITVEWDSTTSLGLGDNQGYVVMTGDQGHAAHMPAWMRVVDAPADADVLIIDNDFSDLMGFPDYTPIYTATLDGLGYTYEVWNADLNFTLPATIPDVATLSRYTTIIYQTGDNYYPDGTFTVSTPPTQLDMDRLVGYVNNGGHLVALGQDLASVFNSAVTDGGGFFYAFTLGANYLQDSVNGFTLTADPQLLAGLPDTPFSGMSFDIGAGGDGAVNQFYIDEIDRTDPEPDSPEDWLDQVRPLLNYAPGGNNVREGYVALSHRDQPSLERPGSTLAGTTLYFSFGMEGVNNDTGFNTREDLLGSAIAWGLDSATATITPEYNGVGEVSTFTAEMVSSIGGPGVYYRWDFGDGSGITESYTSATAGHTYETEGTFTVRVEATNQLGTRALGEVIVGDTATFVDVPTSHWAWQWIEAIFNAGITEGCATDPLAYCPGGSVSRAELAVFLVRGMHGPYFEPQPAGGLFNDVPTDYWAARWIEQLAVDGVTIGCSASPPLFCPTNSVARAGMAVFMLRAKYGPGYTPPAATGTIFGDIPIDHWAADWIEQLAAEGITGGCGDGSNFCPDITVTRDQMAVFLVRTFGLPLP